MAMTSLSKDEIFTQLQSIFLEQFEIEPSQITLDANLYEDLDIDSIDAVNLMIELKSMTQRKIGLEEFNAVKTVADVVNTVEKILLEQQSD